VHDVIAIARASAANGDRFEGVITPQGVITPWRVSIHLPCQNDGVSPNQPKTPLRSFRIPQDLYEAAQAKAAVEGKSLSDVVRLALENYVAPEEEHS